MNTGRTFWAEFWHRVMGWEEFWVDTAEVYPKRVTWTCVALGASIVIGAWWHYHATDNHRLLVGQQLTRGHTAFSSIKVADDASEDFADAPARRKSISAAQTRLADFQQYAKTDEEMRAGSVLSFYLDEVRQIPDRDRDCSKAMQTAQQAGANNTQSASTDEQLVVAEVGALTCMSGRSQAIAIKNICRDEALSYLIPNRQPPVDSCMFRHMAQTDTVQ